MWPIREHAFSLVEALSGAVRLYTYQGNAVAGDGFQAQAVPVSLSLWVLITAGASAPEILVQEVIGAVRDRFDIITDEISVTTETTHFKLPRALTA